MIYDFQCDKCGFQEEKILSLNQFEQHKKTPEHCPTCDGKMQHKISLSSFHLKGDGWYKDHYGLKNNN